MFRPCYAPTNYSAVPPQGPIEGDLTEHCLAALLCHQTTILLPSVLRCCCWAFAKAVSPYWVESARWIQL